MNANTKSTLTDPISCATAFYNRRFQTAVEAGKSSMDLAFEQNSAILAFYRKALKGSALPGQFLFNFTDQALEGAVAMQKRLLNLAVQQGAAVTKAAQEYRQSGRLFHPQSPVIETATETPEECKTTSLEQAFDTLLA